MGYNFFVKKKKKKKKNKNWISSDLDTTWLWWLIYEVEISE